jgi:adenylate cyclase
MQLFVIARNTSFTYRRPHRSSVKQVGRNSACAVLEGSVRRGGGRGIRVTAQLIDVDTLATTYGRSATTAILTDVFAVQDEIPATAVIRAIGPAVAGTLGNAAR